jgi:hypothetical protein
MEPKQPMNNKIVLYLIFALLSLLLAAGMFSYTMNEPLMHDENMYITAGYLLKDYALYTDFSFLQMPYLPMLYAAVYTVTDTSYYVLTARLMTFFFVLLSVLLMYAISLRLTGDMIVSLLLTVFFVVNEITVWIMGFAWNAVHSMTFALLGVYLYLTIVPGGRNEKVLLFLSGVAIAISAGFKSYYVMIIPVFLLVSFLFPRSLPLKRKFVKYTLPLIVGIFTGSVPVLYYLLKDFDLFMFNNLTFHYINELEPYGVEGMPLKSRIQTGLKFLAMPTNIIIFVGLFFSFLLVIDDKSSIKTGDKIFFTTEIILLLGLVLATIPIPFIATPIWDHYFGLSIPFAILLIAALYKTFTGEHRKIITLLLVCLFPIVLLFGGPVLFERIHRLFALNEWEGVKIHRISHEIKHSIGPLKENDKVATLNPVFLLDAGIPFYKEFSSGVFLYQVGDMIDKVQRDKYITTSPNMLHDFFSADPPRALLIVRLQRHDYPFFDYVEEMGYIEHEKWFYGHSLFLRELTTTDTLYNISRN